MSEETDALIKRAERAEAARAAVQPLLQEIYRYAMPERNAWESYGLTQGQDRNSTVWTYSSAGIVGTTRFANRLQQALVPPGQKWARLALPADRASDDAMQKVQEALERATSLMFAEIHASNFDAEMNAAAYDLAAGYACLLVENGRTTQRRPAAPLLMVRAIAPAKVAFDEGPWGSIEGVFFSQDIPARLVARTYPDAKLPDELVRQARDAPETLVALLQCTTYDAEKMRWRLCVVMRERKEVLLEREYRTNPWIIPRWARVPGEVYPRGPLAQALPDLRTANKLEEYHLLAAAYEADPPYTAADQGVLNEAVVAIAPGEIVNVRSNGTGMIGPSLKVLERPQSLRISDALLERLHTSIRMALFDNPLPPEVQVGLTATEVLERIRMFQSDTGSFGRLHRDFVTPFILRAIDILEEAGVFARAGLADLFSPVRDGEVHVRVVSPIAAAQERMDVQTVMEIVSGAASLGEFGAMMLRAAVDPERAGRFVAEQLGVPHELIPTRGELVEQREQAQRQAQAEMLATSPVAAQAVGAIAGQAARAASPAEGPA